MCGMGGHDNLCIITGYFQAIKQSFLNMSMDMSFGFFNNHDVKNFMMPVVFKFYQFNAIYNIFRCPSPSRSISISPAGDTVKYFARDSISSLILTQQLFRENRQGPQSHGAFRLHPARYFQSVGLQKSYY